MVQRLSKWPRVREGVPFDTSAFNRLLSFLDGYVAAPFRLVQSNGSPALTWTPDNDLFVFGASITLGATTTLGNTIHFDSYAADGTSVIHLLRVTNADLIELGEAGVSMSVLASLSNNVALLGRNAAGSGDVTILKVNASDILELGASGTRLSVLSPLTNNTPLYGRNAANSGSVLLLNLNGSDIIELGASGTRLSPLSPITNNTALGFRNAANSATVSALLLNASDYFEFGASGTRVTISSPLTNNTKLTGRNAANSASVDLIGLNNSDQVDVGVSGTQTNLLGTVVAPSIDPPTVNGQVTVGSQIAAAAHVRGGGGTGSIVSDGSVTFGNNYNVASVTRNLAGDYSIAVDRDFSDAYYVVQVTVIDDSAVVLIPKVNSQTASSFDVHIWTTAGTKTDPDGFSVTCWGTLS